MKIVYALWTVLKAVGIFILKETTKEALKALLHRLFPKLFKGGKKRSFKLKKLHGKRFRKPPPSSNNFNG